MPVCRRLPLRWIVAYAAMFLVVMPIVGQDLVYSAYRSAEWTAVAMRAKILQDHERRLAEAEEYIRTLEPRSRAPDPDDGLIDLTMVIVSSRRTEHSRPLGYLTRTAAALSRSTISAPWPATSQIFICDVNAGPAPHLEADRLRQFFHVVARFPNYSASAAILDPFEKEKQDYAFCLQRALQFTSTHILAVEDDAVARDDLFHVLPHILHSRTLAQRTTSWSHLKLYYPERWQGFSLDVRTMLELASVFCLAYAAWVAMIRLCWQEVRQSFCHGISGGVLAVLVAVSIGRQHLVELKRISLYFHSLAADPECCSPAIFYSAEFVRRLVPFLVNEVRCSNDYPLDMALSSFVGRLQWRGYRVEPNLFRHIGLISTTKGYSRHLEDFLM